MEWVIALTAIGCGTAIVLTFIDKVFGNRGKQFQAQARAAEDRVRQLEVQLADARRQNELLEKQVEWHAKLLETQDRLVKQLGPGGPVSGGPGNGAPAAPSSSAPSGS